MLLEFSVATMFTTVASVLITLSWHHSV